MNPELVKTLQRIKENEAKLAEIERRRAELLRKRRLELAEPETPQQQDDESVKKKPKHIDWSKLNLNTPKVEMEVRSCVTTLETLTAKVKPEDQAVTKYKFKNHWCFLLVAGDEGGSLQVWDVLGGFERVRAVVIKAKTAVHQIKYLNFALKIPSVDSTAPYVVATVATDLYIVSLIDLSIITHMEELFSSEVQKMVATSYHDQDVVFCATLECWITCFSGNSWEPLYRLNGHTESVLSLCYFPATEDDPKSACVLSGSDDSTIRVWNIHSIVSTPIKPPVVADTGAKSGAAEEDSITMIENCETVIKHHEEFVDTMCYAKIGDAPKESESYLISGSGDFRILISNRKWEKLHVLAQDKFAASITVVSNVLYITYKSAAEDEDCVSYLAAYDTKKSADPNSWTMTKLKNRIRATGCVISRPMDLRILTPDPKAQAKMPPAFPFIATAAKDGPFVDVWITPLKMQPKSVPPPVTKPPAAPIPTPTPAPAPILQPPQTRVEQPRAVTTAAPRLETSSSHNTVVPPVAPSTPNSLRVDEQDGDVFAKRFIRSILDLPGLSPDMSRLLNCCLRLHESS